MAHFAKIKNDIVEQVIVLSNESCGEPTLTFPDTDEVGQAFIANTLKLDGVWLQTSYNANFRGCYAGIGFTFDADLGEYGEFVPPPTIEPDNDEQ